MFAYALTRKPGRNFSRGLTTANLGPPNYELILKQHASYVDALKTIGVDVIELDVSEMQKMDGGLTCLSLRF